MLSVMQYRIQIWLACLTLILPSAILATETTGIKTGQPAPEFELRDLRGKKRSLADLRKSGQVLLLFWSTHCHFCYSMIPQFKNLHENYGKKGLQLVAINVGYETRNEVKDFARENRLPYLVLNDDDKKEDIIEQYQVRGTPTLVLVERDGRISYSGHRLPDLSKFVTAAN